MITFGIIFFFIRQKQWRDKDGERKQEHCENMREIDVQRLSQNSGTNIFSWMENTRNMEVWIVFRYFQTFS